MLIQRAKFLGDHPNASPIKLKPLINCRHLQTLKQKIANQSTKISNFKFKEVSQDNKGQQQDIKKKNKSNDFSQRRHLIKDFLNQNQSRKASDAHILLQQYFNNKQQHLLKNKSELLSIKQHSPRQQKQRINAFFCESSAVKKVAETNQKASWRQSIYEQLKTTISTTASSNSSSAIMTKVKVASLAETKNVFAPSAGDQQKSSNSLKIQDFQIIKYLQEGQFGAVYLARHLPTSFLCALKKIPKSIFGDDPQYIGQLARQIKIQSYLQHPNIVRLYSTFHDKDSIYLMLQYCSGGSLYNNLKKQVRLPQEKVKKYMNQICHAVQYMHDNDIIHRDIKPQNILVQNDIVKICDFGWSINSPLLRSTHCGTPLYSSPEIILKQQYDSKVDVWNVGIMAYELLYGKLTFQIRSEEELMKIVQEDIYFSKSYPVSQIAKDFILKCLKKNPRERDSINKLLDHSFFQF